MSEAVARRRPLESSVRPRLILEGVDGSVGADPLPSWRGVLHEKAFAVAPALGLLLVTSAGEARAQVAAAVFATTMTAMLGVSAVNHRALLAPTWQPWLRRADHTAIHFFLAGTWSAVALVALSGTTRIVLTALVWGAAVAASLVTFVWVGVPGWIPATIGVAVGWSTAAAFMGTASLVHPAGVALFLVGGVGYTAGAIVYALRRPKLHATFGYHELFHLLVLVGVVCHYLTLAFFVLPAAE